jgi:hypothetical protein
MTTFSLLPASTGSAALFADPVLQLGISAYLGRFNGSSREHTGSDLRVYLAWCAEHDVEPLAAQRADLERYIRWLQEIRRFKRVCCIERPQVILTGNLTAGSPRKGLLH